MLQSNAAPKCGCTNWVAAKEFKLSYHNGYLWQFNIFPNIVTECKSLNSNPANVGDQYFGIQGTDLNPKS